MVSCILSQAGGLVIKPTVLRTFFMQLPYGHCGQIQNDLCFSHSNWTGLQVVWQKNSFATGTMERVVLKKCKGGGGKSGPRAKSTGNCASAVDLAGPWLKMVYWQGAWRKPWVTSTQPPPFDGNMICEGRTKNSGSPQVSLPRVARQTWCISFQRNCSYCLFHFELLCWLGQYSCCSVACVCIWTTGFVLFNKMDPGREPFS